MEAAFINNRHTGLLRSYWKWKACHHFQTDHRLVENDDRGEVQPQTTCTDANVTNVHKKAVIYL